MMNFLKTIGTGAWRGTRAFLKLMMVVGPVYTVMTILKFTPVLGMFANFMAPYMRFFRLPGEAAMALILGNFINIYASLGVIIALRLPRPQLTVLSLMLLISHSQLLESAVFFQIRAKWWLLWFIRLIVALLVGIGLGALIVPAGMMTGGTIGPGSEYARPLKQFSFLPALKEWGLGLYSTGVKMLLVLVAIFIVLELARRFGVLERVLNAIQKVIGFMGFSREAGMPWLAGNVFGIVFGAGVITETVREGRLSPKQVTLVASFLALCHGLFEDTAIFVVMGANLFWILVPRIVLAVIVTWVLSRILKDSALTRDGGRG
ncbi:MAG: hypothetical protein ABIK44_04390 [candidate division WOR-3 bacterium]